MRRAPRPGFAHSILDCTRLLVGLRLLPNALITLLFPLPLPLAAVTHVFVFLLTRNDEAYCATEARPPKHCPGLLARVHVWARCCSPCAAFPLAPPVEA